MYYSFVFLNETIAHLDVKNDVITASKRAGVYLM